MRLIAPFLLLLLMVTYAYSNDMSPEQVEGYVCALVAEQSIQLAAMFGDQCYVRMTTYVDSDTAYKFCSSHVQSLADSLSIDYNKIQDLIFDIHRLRQKEGIAYSEKIILPAPADLNRTVHSELYHDLMDRAFILTIVPGRLFYLRDKYGITVTVPCNSCDDCSNRATAPFWALPKPTEVLEQHIRIIREYYYSVCELAYKHWDWSRSKIYHETSEKRAAAVRALYDLDR